MNWWIECTCIRTCIVQYIENINSYICKTLFHFIGLKSLSEFVYKRDPQKRVWKNEKENHPIDQLHLFSKPSQTQITMTLCHFIVQKLNYSLKKKRLDKFQFFNCFTLLFRFTFLLISKFNKTYYLNQTVSPQT